MVKWMSDANRNNGCAIRTNPPHRYYECKVQTPTACTLYRATVHVRQRIGVLIARPRANTEFILTGVLLRPWMAGALENAGLPERAVPTALWSADDAVRKSCALAPPRRSKFAKCEFLGSV